MALNVMNRISNKTINLFYLLDFLTALIKATIESKETDFERNGCTRSSAAEARFSTSFSKQLTRKA